MSSGGGISSFCTYFGGLPRPLPFGASGFAPSPVSFDFGSYLSTGAFFGADAT
jgi:hypothetical protein